MHYLLIALCTAACLRFGAEAKPLLRDGDNDIGDNGIDSWDTPGSSESDSHTIFLIPRKLKEGDKIKVFGKILEKTERLTLGLVARNKEEPDYKNVACQLIADFDVNKVSLNAVFKGEVTRNDEDHAPAHELFYGSNFTVIFTVDKQKSILINVGDSSTANNCEVKHEMEDIVYLIIEGIEKVEEIHYLLA